MVTRPTLAVTGATGFLGRAFVNAVCGQGRPVLALGRSPIGSPDMLWAHFDLAAPRPIDPAVLVGVKTIVHLAAYIPRNQTDAGEVERCFAHNALGTLRLVEAAASAGVSRFVHTVSANAYAPELPHPDETAQMLPTRRGSFYLASKISQEIFATHLAASAGMSICTLRVSSVYDSAAPTGVLKNIIREIEAGEVVSLANGGRYGTDWIEVHDVVDALMLALNNDMVGAFNVGSGVRTTLLELAAFLTNYFRRESGRINIQPFDQPNDIGFAALDISRLRRFGFAPRTLIKVLGHSLETTMH